MLLKVQLLNENAKLPTVAHPTEDLGYDIYASEDVTLLPWQIYKVPTGIAVEARSNEVLSLCEGQTGLLQMTRKGRPLGLIVKDRSSMAAKDVFTHAGVIDSGYRGEIVVLMTTLAKSGFLIRKGDKIAQLVPVPVLTGEVIEVEDFSGTSRGAGGFGSSGA